MDTISKPDRKHALVIGGSVAGLLTARVLADHYQSVTILDRDVASGKGHRRGCPQDRHTHVLLAAGKKVIEKLFPGIADEWLASGAVPMDGGRDILRFYEGGCFVRFTSGLSGLGMTRPCFEATLRSRVCQIPWIQLRGGVLADGLITTPDRNRVIGVRTGTETLLADLVVDATGKGSHAPEWLETLGYQRPQKDSIRMSVSYTTRFFRRSAAESPPQLAISIAPTPSGKRAGVMIAQEDDAWAVTLMSHFGAAPPSELAGFVEFARSLPAPYIYEAIRNLEPIREAASTHMPSSVRHRYEKLVRFPEGFLVVGDALSYFNPFYGQGMASAAMQASELSHVLTEGLAPVHSEFFARAARQIDVPWAIAANGDLRIPETVGPRTARLRFLNWYLSQLVRGAQKDPRLVLIFLAMQNMVLRPEATLAPRTAARVLYANLGLSRRAPVKPASTQSYFQRIP